MKRKPKPPAVRPPKRHARKRPRKGVNPAPNDLGASIRAAREDKGLTQLALAHAIGYQGDDAGACVSRWEEGVYTPTLANLARIADALGVTVGSLLPTGGDLAGKTGMVRDKKNWK